VISVRIQPTYDSWHDAARRLLRGATPPGQVLWDDGERAMLRGLAQEAPPPPERDRATDRLMVPRRFVEEARWVAAHSDPARWDVMYRVLFRILHENRRLLDVAADADVSRFAAMSKQTHQDEHQTFGDDMKETALAFMPEDRSLPSLRRAAASCQGCPLFARATQTVFGEGPGDARIALVGEQPGDEEAIRGRPFVGPAGDVLDRALAEAGVERAAVYVTNVVKHFSWEPRGKRRIHLTPRLSEIRACRPWLEAELEVLRPPVLVALGSIAARTIFGPQFRVLTERGQVRRTSWAEHTVATLHPSAVLRADSPETAETYFAWIVNDLGLALEASAGRASQAQVRL